MRQAWTFSALLLASVSVLAQTAPVADASSDDAFVVNSGDTLRVSVFQSPDLGIETRVDAAGRMTYPFLGQVDVKGKTPAQVERLIASGLEEKQILRKPQVTVNVVQFKSQQVSVLGNVNRPGKYPLDLPYSVSDVLAIAGGVTQAGADFVVLSRMEKGAVRNTEIDLLQMFTPGGQRAEDVAVLPGDVLYVHRAPVFYIYGEVQRPGAFRLERNMTVLQALSAGGGLTQRGTERGLRITRRTIDGTQTQIDGNTDTRLQADDVIYIKESLF